VDLALIPKEWPIADKGERIVTNKMVKTWVRSTGEAFAIEANNARKKPMRQIVVGGQIYKAVAGHCRSG
jgi:hypothetical protein